MGRVTDVEVKEILSTTIDTTPFILAANLIVTDKLGDSENLSAAQLKEIERWLAAHLACAKDPRARTKSISGVTKGYGGMLGMGLDFTEYGQMVKILDTTGILVALGKKEAKLETLDWR